MSFRDHVIAPGQLATTRVGAARWIPAVRAAVDRVQQTFAQLRGIRQVVGSWIRRRNDRAFLRSLSPRDRHDFCPRQSEAEAEMNKPFWQA